MTGVPRSPHFWAGSGIAHYFSLFPTMMLSERSCISQRFRLQPKTARIKLNLIVGSLFAMTPSKQPPSFPHRLCRFAFLSGIECDIISLLTFRIIDKFCYVSRYYPNKSLHVLRKSFRRLPKCRPRWKSTSLIPKLTR